MNWIFIAVFAFSVLTIHCLNDKTVGELKATLKPLQKRLDSAVADYKKHNYVAFENAVDGFESVSEITNLSDSATVDPESKHSRQTFDRLTSYQFIYPVLSDPIKLSDALKLNALFSSLDSRSLKGVKNRTEMIIELENKRDFSAAYSNLEELYYDSNYNSTRIFYLISGYSKHTLGLLKEYIHNHDLQVGSYYIPEMLRNIERAELFLKKFEKLLPFDKQEKIEPMVEVLEEYRKLYYYFYYPPIPVECFGIRCEERKQKGYEIQETIHSTLPELINAVEYYKADLDDRIAFYKDYNYTVFARTALQYVFSPTLKSAIERLPPNSTIDDSLEAKETFTKLTIYKYLYPILIDPYYFSKAFVADAILNKIIKNQLSDPVHGLKETEDTIGKIIAQLKKMNYRFNQSDLTFNDLHKHLGVPNSETFVLTFYFVKQQIKVMEDFCGSKSGLCSEKLTWNLEQFKYWNGERGGFPGFHYFDLPNWLEKFWKFRSEVEKNKLEENIDCDVLKCTKKAKTLTETMIEQ